MVIIMDTPNIILLISSAILIINCIIIKYVSQYKRFKKFDEWMVHIFLASTAVVIGCILYKTLSI